MIIALLISAFANDGFTEVKQAGDCVYEQRPKTHVDGAAMRATCKWPDVDPVGFAEQVARYEAYEDYVFAIDQSDVRRVEHDRSLVYQLQQIWGLADREVLLWMSAEPLQDGIRHRWVTATEEPLELRTGAIRTPKNEGFWEVRANPHGPGSLVVQEIAIEAGGMPLPQWLVGWIRTRGFVRVMDDARAGALPPTVAAGTNAFGKSSRTEAPATGPKGPTSSSKTDSVHIGAPVPR